MFRRVTAPTLFPACSLTRNTVGPMVDTEVILQTGGRVYLTETEGWEVVNKFETFAEQLGVRATSLGWTSPDDTAAAEARIAVLEQRIVELENGAPKVMTLADVQKMWDGEHAVAR